MSDSPKSVSGSDPFSFQFTASVPGHIEHVKFWANSKYKLLFLQPFVAFPYASVIDFQSKMLGSHFSMTGSMDCRSFMHDLSSLLPRENFCNCDYSLVCKLPTWLCETWLCWISVPLTLFLCVCFFFFIFLVVKIFSDNIQIVVIHSCSINSCNFVLLWFIFSVLIIDFLWGFY